MANRYLITVTWLKVKESSKQRRRKRANVDRKKKVNFPRNEEYGHVGHVKNIEF